MEESSGSRATRAAGPRFTSRFRHPEPKEKAVLEPTVFVVDDDDAIRDSLQMLIKSVGLGVETFGTAKQFLAVHDPARPGCLVLDLRMPEMSGHELQARQTKNGSTLPIIFITGHGDVPAAVSAMQAGAIDFLQKPFRDQDLLDRIQQAIERDAALRKKLRDRSEIQSRMARLTPRESEVMTLVVRGDANKAIAYDLGLSERTVEIHRARVMKKMEADSLPQLVQMVVRVRDQTEST
jgi:FixJ family two-component response regulator